MREGRRCENHKPEGENFQRRRHGMLLSGSRKSALLCGNEGRDHPVRRSARRFRARPSGIARDEVVRKNTSRAHPARRTRKMRGRPWPPSPRGGAALRPRAPPPPPPRGGGGGGGGGGRRRRKLRTRG